MGTTYKQANLRSAALLLTVVAAAPMSAQGPITPPPGLVAWWAMDGSADDIGPLGLNGALALSGGSFPAGRVLAGFNPTAPDGQVAVPDAPELRVQTNFTFEGWVRVDALAAGTSYFLNKGTTAHRFTPYVFGVIGSSGLLPVTPGASITGTRAPGRPFVTLSSGTLEQLIVGGTAMPLGTFVHVAFVVQTLGTQWQCRIYQNGVQTGLAFLGGPAFAGVQALHIGGTSGSSSLNGVVDELTLYNRVLTLAEIQSIFAAGAAGKLKPVHDHTPPVVTIGQPVTGTVVGSRSVGLSVTVADESTTQVASTPAGVQGNLPAGGGQLAGVVLVPGPDGDQIIAVSATDSAGNIGGSSVTVTLDTTPPAVSVLSPPEGAVLAASPATLAIQVSDLTATSVQVGAAVQSLSPGQNAVNLDAPLVEGPNAVQVDVVDAAGNHTVVVRHLVLDTSAPQVAITAPPDGALFSAAATGAAVTVRVDDLSNTSVDSAPAGVAGDLPPGGGLLSGVVPLHEGLNQISAHAMDQVGHEATVTITVNRDSTPPNVTLSGPAANSAVRGQVELQVDASDVAPGSGVLHVDLFDGTTLLASAAGASLHLDLDTATQADGMHTLIAVAQDGAGNSGSTPLPLLFDNTPPGVRVLSPLENEIVHGTVPFVVAADDGGSGLVTLVQRVDGRAPSQDGSATFAPPVASWQADGAEDTTLSPNGPLQLEVEATDLAGNSTLVQVDVDVQNLLPDGPGLRPADGARVRRTVTLRLTTAAADVTLLELLVDGVRVASGHQSTLRLQYDTTTRLDGPMVVRGEVHTSGGSAATEHTLHVSNMHVQELAPHDLSLQASGGQNRVVRALVTGPNLGLLLPLAQHRVELRLPGTSPVPAQSVTPLPHHGHEQQVLAFGFDRAALVAALLAARAGGSLPPNAEHVWIHVFVDGTSIGRARLELHEEHHGGEHH